MRAKAPVLLTSEIPEPFSRQATGEYDFMSGSVVIGQINIEGEEPGGLEEAHSIHFKHMADGYDQLMNMTGVGTPGCKIGEPGRKMRKEAKRPTSNLGFYPTIVYKAGKELVVGKGGPENLKADQAAEKLALDGGWRKEPYLKPQIAVLDAQTEKKEMLERNNVLQTQLIALSDQIRQMQAEQAARETKN